MLDVFYDYVGSDNEFEVGFMVIDNSIINVDEKIIYTDKMKIDMTHKEGNLNQHHKTLIAYNFTLVKLKEYLIDNELSNENITFFNQNGDYYNWLRYGKENYDYLLERVKDGLSFYYKPGFIRIKSEMNKCKDLIKKLSKGEVKERSLNNVVYLSSNKKFSTEVDDDLPF
jgi:hypothetical protein